MKIAFYKSEHGKKIDHAISLVTRSPYSHCELVFSDDICASASPRDGGIRFKRIQLGYKWDVYTLPPSVDEAFAREWFLTHEAHTYDFLGAFGSAFNLDLTSKNKKFCSYSCASALKMSEIIISPGKLHSILKIGAII